jgi:hypothetical protein
MVHDPDINILFTRLSVYLYALLNETRSKIDRLIYFQHSWINRQNHMQKIFVSLQTCIKEIITFQGAILLQCLQLCAR